MSKLNLPGIVHIVDDDLIPWPSEVEIGTVLLVEQNIPTKSGDFKSLAVYVKAEDPVDPCRVSDDDRDDPLSYYTLLSTSGAHEASEMLDYVGYMPAGVKASDWVRRCIERIAEFRLRYKHRGMRG